MPWLRPSQAHSSRKMLTPAFGVIFNDLKTTTNATTKTSNGEQQWNYEIAPTTNQRTDGQCDHIQIIFGCMQFICSAAISAAANNNNKTHMFRVFFLVLDTLQSLSAPLVQLLLLFHINSYELFYYTHAHTHLHVCVFRFMCSVVCIYRFLFLFTVRSMALLMKMNTCVRFGATRDPNERCRLSKKSIWKEKNSNSNNNNNSQ